MTSPIPPTDPRDQKHYFFADTFIRRVITLLTRFLFWLAAEWRVSGVENLPPEGPVVLAANHLTEFDMFPMQYAIPRLLFFMGKAELFRNPIMDVLFRHLGAFPVERGARDQWAIQQALKVLQQVQVLGIFPEGTRSRGRGLLPAKTGAARLAIEAKCPVVLMAVNGTQRVLKHFPRREQVTITLSEPLYPRSGEAALDFTDRPMFKLAEMLPPEERGVYAEKPKGFED